MSLWLQHGSSKTIRPLLWGVKRSQHFTITLVGYAAYCACPSAEELSTHGLQLYRVLQSNQHPSQILCTNTQCLYLPQPQWFALGREKRAPNLSAGSRKPTLSWQPSSKAVPYFHKAFFVQDCSRVAKQMVGERIFSGHPIMLIAPLVNIVSHP